MTASSTRAPGRRTSSRGSGRRCWKRSSRTSSGPTTNESRELRGAAMRRFLAQVLILGGMLAFAPDPVHAQGKDPNDALANELIVAQLPGRSVTAMITHQPGAAKFTHAVRSEEHTSELQSLR